MPISRPVSVRSRQRGMSLVAVAMILGVMGLALFGISRMQMRTAAERAGLVSGAALELVSNGVNEYRTTNIGTLTASLTPEIPGFANAMAPTIAELKTAGYLSSIVGETLGDAGAYNVVLEREPAGCIAPAATCTVWSRMHLSNPIVDPGNGQPDINRLGALLSRVRESASYSVPGSAATITGGNGSWSIPNPDPADRAGIVVVVAGLGGANEPWLRVQDTRNPEFKGPSVTGTQFNTANVAIGGACTVNGAFASSPQGVAFCYAGAWVLYGAEVAAPLAACTVEGVLGQTTTGQSLICVGGTWRDNLTYGFRGTGYYAHNEVVPQPGCGTGLVPRAVVGGTSAAVILGANNAGNNTGSWQVEINPGTWAVQIIGSDGSQAGNNARAQVTTFCVVP